MSLSWRVQNIVVMGRVYSKLERSEFSSNFEFDRNMLSGMGARLAHAPWSQVGKVAVLTWSRTKSRGPASLRFYKLIILTFQNWSDLNSVCSDLIRFIFFRVMTVRHCVTNVWPIWYFLYKINTKFHKVWIMSSKSLCKMVPCICTVTS